MKQNVFDCRLTIHEASIVDRGDGFVFLKTSGFDPHRVSDNLHAHVTAIAFDNEDVGVEMWAHATSVLCAMGYKTLQFGGDYRHFFPGCPVECERLVRFLEARGMTTQGDDQVDLERDLVDYKPPVDCSPEARVCGPEDRGLLDEFFKREFPGRWHVDTMGKFEDDPHRVIGLFIEGVCQGFAMTQLNGDMYRYAGAVWSADLGPHWGALGPIGVSKTVRGHGFGDGLLATALCDLRDNGARQTIIDWTTLVDFYGKHGFKVARTYRTYRSELV